ncbi:MAG TPA: ABC transporter permease [Pseudonocardia sp.]|uniref:ABC transporter permease n=1 Tax=Pseudonocardia sp. TaxID=60912 RepID=UPI002C4B8CF1|nr:ABC transporter permease [Pseudonocardia sp.]HTF53789.1 ABC transporter permease [Pseudonocardia sp.]
MTPATKTATSTASTSLTPLGVPLGRRVLDAGPVLALVLMVVVFSVISGRFLTVPNAGSIANQASILLVLAVGSTFVILLGGIDLSIEGVMATSSLVTVLLAANDRNGSNLGYFAVLVGAAVGAVFGLVNGLLHTRMRIPSFMVTLGTGAIGIGIATVLFGGQPPRLLDDGLRAWGTERVAGFPRLLLVAVLVLALGYLIQRLTRIGRYILVIGGDEQIAKLSGVSVPRYKVYAFVLSGTASGLAGAMASTQLGVGDVQVGSGQMFATITAVVVGGTALTGGRGGVLQTLIGVLLISVLANGLILVGVDPSIQRSVQGVVIVLAIAATAWTQRHRLRVIK